ncbi:MAG TPA: DUF4214 domain-containing protein [Pirellulales bacterium]|nr:DUF4214 domain-containing protein [Pirellulales bacterium]
MSQPVLCHGRVSGAGNARMPSVDKAPGMHFGRLLGLLGGRWRPRRLHEPQIHQAVRRRKPQQRTAALRRVELLELRAVLSTLSIDSTGSLAYYASAGIGSDLTISLTNGTYTFHDSAEPINILGTGSGAWSGSGTNTASGPASSLSQILVAGGGENDAVNIESLAVPTTVTDSSGFFDAINVGDNGSLQGIQGQLNLENPPAFNTINLDDSSDTTARTVSLQNTPSPLSGDADPWGAVTGLAPAAINYEYPDTASITIDGGNGGDTLNVLQTGAPTNLIGGHYATINVGNNGSVQGIQGALNLENPPAFNTINLNDTSDTRTRTVIVGNTSSPFSGDSDPWGAITGLAPAAIKYEYTDTSRVTVDLPNAYFFNATGGQVGSSITVTPRSGLLYNINGDPSFGAPGNSLTVSNANGTVVDHPTGAYAGYFTFEGSSSEIVSYRGIQSPTPIGLLVAGSDAGSSPEVKVYNAQTGDQKFDLHPFDPSFLGGVRVAVGDVNGDGIPDIITAQGPGSNSSGDSLVQVFDGFTGQQLAGPLGWFDPFPGFHGGLYVTSADLNGDGYADLIVAQGAGGQGWVDIFSGKTGALLAQFQPYGSGYTGGVRLAAGPVVNSNGQIHLGLVTGEGPGGAPLVDVFDVPGLLAGNDTPASSFDAFDPSFTGGVYVATGAIHDQGHPPASIIVGAGAGGEPRVSVFDGTGAPLQTFLAFDPGFHGGVRVAAADVTGSGRYDIVAAEGPGPGSLPQVRAFDGVSLDQIDQFFAFAADDRDGMFLAGGGRWGLVHEVSQPGAHPPVEQKSPPAGGAAASDSGSTGAVVPAVNATDSISPDGVSDPANSLPGAVMSASTNPPARSASPAASYVGSAFQDVLHHAPDASALSYWTAQITDGLMPAQFASDLTHSAEFYSTNVIAPAYQTYLGRAPDAAGIAYWTRQMQQGMSDQQIEADFIASPEFYAHASGANSGWVKAMYQVVLGRPADTTGMSYWLAELSAGASRSNIALGFAASGEREAQMIEDDYFTYLGRAASAAEVSYWLAQFGGRATNEDILSGFIGSSEYVRLHPS